MIQPRKHLRERKGTYEKDGKIHNCILLCYQYRWVDGVKCAKISFDGREMVVPQTAVHEA